MKSKSPIIPERVRRITGSFSWLDHRLISDGFLSPMQSEEMLLYFFLVLVGDRNGVSFYSYDRICAILKITMDQFICARDRLINMSLIAVQDGRYQVLELPKMQRLAEPDRCRQMLSIHQVLERALQKST
jgi:hypothetical protein